MIQIDWCRFTVVVSMLLGFLGTVGTIALVANENWWWVPTAVISAILMGISVGVVCGA